MAQRVGPVTIEDTGDDDDLTVIQVPTEAVGFVTGSNGNFLRQARHWRLGGRACSARHSCHSLPALPVAPLAQARSVHFLMMPFQGWMGRLPLKMP